MIRFAFAATLVFGALFSTTASAQDDRQAARTQFERGVGLYESGEYQNALEAFQEAYRLAPHPAVRVNMANCYEHLDRPIEAIHHFERYLAEAETAPRPQRREVQAALARLRQLVGEVRLSIAPDGALVTVDGTETRRAPVLEPFLLGRGTHTVEVRLDGYVSTREEITVAGGETQRVAIRLERPRPREAVVTATDPANGGTPTDTEDSPARGTGDPGGADDPDGSLATSDQASDEAPVDDGGGFELRFTTPVIIAGSATAAFGIGAIVTGVLALTFNDQFENAVLRVNVAATEAERSLARQDGLRAADSANTLSILTDVFIIGTVAAAGLTAFFVIIEGMDGDDSMAQGGGELRLVAAPSVSRDGGGFVLGGSF